MRMKRTAGLLLSLALTVLPATAALAKPISTYSADFYFGAEDVLSITFDDTQVTSVSLSMSCGGSDVLSYESTSVDVSLVAVGPKATRFELSAQFTGSFTDCDGSQSTATRHVRVSNFNATGQTVRTRDGLTGTRTLAVPVEADVTFTTLPNQPLVGTLTEVISKG